MALPFRILKTIETLLAFPQNARSVLQKQEKALIDIADTGNKTADGETLDLGPRNGSSRRMKRNFILFNISVS